MGACAYWDTAHAVNQTADKPYYLFDGYAHLAAGLACGLAGLAAGMAIGIVGDAGVRWASSAAAPALIEPIEGCPSVLLLDPQMYAPVCIASAHSRSSRWTPIDAFLCRANAQQPKLFVGMILILIFAEALALYGLIGVPLFLY